MLPLVLPPALQAMIPPPPANASPEQIRNHHTAAAAAAAAAASVMAPYSHHMMMPPTIVPMTMSVQHQAAASAAVRLHYFELYCYDAMLTAHCSGIFVAPRNSNISLCCC